MNWTCSNNPMVNGNWVSYSPAVTLALTHNCRNRCLYCGFRDEKAGLLSKNDIQSIIDGALQSGATEALIISGENVDAISSIRKELNRLHHPSFVSYTEKICRGLLKRDLLPHINIGLLQQSDLARLKNCCASMGLMMEGDYGRISSHVQPQKDFVDRLRNLAWAGQLKIPFTTGLILGIGESREDRRRSISAIARVHQTYGHVQEIILQRYNPNRRSSLSAVRVSMKDIRLLVEQVRQEMPGVHLQFPPNLFDRWRELIDMGFDDLGGIGPGEDPVNPDNPWPAVQAITPVIQSTGNRLRKRLPIYPEFYKKAWYAAPVGKTIERIIKKNAEYGYYSG